MAARSPRPQPIQTFRPTNGAILGWSGVAVATVVALYVLVTDPSLRSVQLALALALAAMVVWVTMLRPRATAYEDTLVLRNMLRDTHVPLARIDSAVVRQTLNVWVGGERHVCVGIGQTARSMLRQRGRGTVPGAGLPQHTETSGALAGSAIGAGGPYHQFVETRIEDLAREARRDQRGLGLEVRREWARPELAALGLLGAALVASLLLG